MQAIPGLPCGKLFPKETPLLTNENLSQFFVLSSKSQHLPKNSLPREHQGWSPYAIHCVNLICTIHIIFIYLCKEQGHLLLNLCGERKIIFITPVEKMDME